MQSYDHRKDAKPANDFAGGMCCSSTSLEHAQDGTESTYYSKGAIPANDFAGKGFIFL